MSGRRSECCFSRPQRCGALPNIPRLAVGGPVSAGCDFMIIRLRAAPYFALRAIGPFVEEISLDQECVYRVHAFKDGVWVQAMLNYMQAAIQDRPLYQH